MRRIGFAPAVLPRAARPAHAAWWASMGVLSLALLLVGCGAEATPTPTSPPPLSVSQFPATTPSTVELPSPPSLALDEVPLKCGSPLVFGVDALAAIPGAERADHPAARNLRQFLDDGSLPDQSGWRLVVFNEDGALFLLPRTRGAGVSFWYAEFGPAETGWEAVRWGQCDIQPAFEGVEAARWELAPGEQIGPGTQSFEVRVFEQACASGASPDGRIISPAVIPLEDSLIVIVATRPPPGPQTCQPGPPATVQVQLPEPLGDRQLLDGSTFPGEPRS